MTVNAHRAFDNSASGSYRKNLTPLDHEIEELRTARDKVRTTLKLAFSDWEEQVDAGTLFEDSVVASFTASAKKPNLSPKFRGQGSYSYHTLNQPTHNPPQEMDFDDGMFLPTSFISQDGTVHPAVASEGYFRLVEEALGSLCTQERWTLNPGKTKASCVRISLNNDRSHLDIALYAIPDDQYQVLVEKAIIASRNDYMADEAAGVRLSDAIYETIDPDQIMLAHRDDGWKVSDPRKLENWFAEAVQEHGPQLRRVARYLKGWRDQSWEKCRLSSIALMDCAVRFFDESKEDFVGRDDLAMLAMANILPSYLREEIRNPVVDGRLDEGWDDEPTPCRNEFVTMAEILRDNLAGAIKAKTKEEASKQLTSIFGVHFPDDSALIEVDSTSEAPAIVSSGVLGSLGSSNDAKTAVKIDGDDRYG